jgi:hypothetical protein
MSEALPTLYYCHKSACSLPHLEKSGNKKLLEKPTGIFNNETKVLNPLECGEASEKLSCFFDFSANLAEYEEDLGFQIYGTEKELLES